MIFELIYESLHIPYAENIRRPQITIAYVCVLFYKSQENNWILFETIAIYPENITAHNLVVLWAVGREGWGWQRGRYVVMLKSSTGESIEQSGLRNTGLWLFWHSETVLRSKAKKTTQLGFSFNRRLSSSEWLNDGVSPRRLPATLKMLSLTELY